MRVITVILVIALAGVGYYLLTPEGRQFIDRARIHMTRVDHLARFAAGETLPGTPDLARFDARLAAHGVKLGVPVFIRIFKLEWELELWVEKDGRFVRFATYPVCKWSGRLGPKQREGDRQAPEGFYTVAAEQLNPNSRWHRSFNLGFPNAFDQAHGRTGSFLMVHGGCGSIGCYAMTDPVVDEIWRMVTAALEAGQPRFPVHVFPFRMTERNLRHRRGYQWESFWAELKRGYDLFEASRIPPVVSVCKGRYAFTPGTISSYDSAIEERCPPEIAGNS
jgi:murein L,D-transpeptidase YafK